MGDLLYVGGAAQKLLGQYGVKTIGQLAACKKETLETLMGKMGTQLYEYANGLDSAPVRARLDAEPVKSVGNGTTFPQNLTTRIQVRSGIAVLADSVSTRLRREGLYAGGIQVTVRDPASSMTAPGKSSFRPHPSHPGSDQRCHGSDGGTVDAPGPHPGFDCHRHPPAPRREEAYEQATCSTPPPGSGTPGKKSWSPPWTPSGKKYGGSAIVYGAAQPEKEEDPLP
ncbi:MAG: hypothetical protein ACLU38_03875 [Dysosmobacter sp.]